MLFWLSISGMVPGVMGSPPFVTKTDGISLLKNVALQECAHSSGINSAVSFSSSTAEMCAEQKHNTRLTQVDI